MIKIEIHSKDEAEALGITADNHGRYFQKLYEGCVFDYYSRSEGFGDSSRYATVWDADEQKIKTIYYAYTGLGGTDYNTANVDITPENFAAALASVLPRIREQVELNLEAIHYEEAEKLWGGKRVKVVKGRKYSLGTQGTVKWAGETRFGFSARVIWDDGDEGWIAQRNLEVLNVPPYVRDPEKVEAEIARISKHFWNIYR